jgi:hypothetical protein
MRSILWGLVIIAIGLWVWFSNLGLLSGIEFRRDWPLIIVVLGLMTVGEGISWLVRSRRWRR